jgi:hypothetical protein
MKNVWSRGYRGTFEYQIQSGRTEAAPAATATRSGTMGHSSKSTLDNLRCAFVNPEVVDCGGRD